MVFEYLFGDKYHLKRETLLEAKEITSWDTFFDCAYGEMQIMVICSEHHNWDIDKLSKTLRLPNGKAKVKLDGQEAGVCARSVCVSVKDIHKTDAQESLAGLFGAIKEVLSEVSGKLTEEDGNENEVEIARKGIDEACNQIDAMCRNLTIRLGDNVYAEEISNLLEIGTLDGNGGNRDGFPVVRMLVLLPGSSFECIAQFAKPEFYFFKQIRCVLHDVDQMTINLMEQHRAEIAGLEAKHREELTELKAQYREELAEKDKKIAVETERAEYWKKRYEDREYGSRNHDGNDEQKYIRDDEP